MAEGLTWEGMDEFVSALAAVGAAATREARAAVVEAVGVVEAQAKQNASGRPGPNVVTGTLRRGIIHDPVTPWGTGGWQTKVYPTAIYSRRVELGFRGADSLGRRYNQPGFPYFSPAFEQMRGRIADIYAAHMAVALSSA